MIMLYVTYVSLTTTAIAEGFLPVLVVAADGFRHFSDDAVFIDRNRNTCDVVTSSMSPLDFVLETDPEKIRHFSDDAVYIDRNPYTCVVATSSDDCPA